MIPGLDSAQPPTAAQVGAARAAGYLLWNGYIATRPGVNLLNVWSQADFDRVRVLGSTPIAFCSGWDDPVILGQLARAWNVRLCLDDEDGIRPDGAWVQPFLDASGAGLYGNCLVHAFRTAAFHILSWYPPNPAPATWYDAGCPRPSGPCGWQSQGSHIEFGLDVDSGWYDDWFGGDPAPSLFSGGRMFFVHPNHPEWQGYVHVSAGDLQVHHSTTNHLADAPEGWDYGHPAGVTFLPMSASAGWWCPGGPGDDGWLLVFAADAATGAVWMRSQSYQDATTGQGPISDWTPVQVGKVDLPPSATYVRHTHKATTDTGAPV